MYAVLFKSVLNMHSLIEGEKGLQLEKTASVYTLVDVQIHTHHNYKEYLRTPSKNQIALKIEEYKAIQVIDRLKINQAKRSMAS